MVSKLQEYRRMSEKAQRQLTGSLERWQSFLATASRLYKYPYHEQVMIHAQRPDATACAEFDVWNNTMRRNVRRGSKGIALIDTSGDRERLRYVFDVSDTGTRPNSRSLNLWELREEHIPAVSSMLEKNYGIPAGESFAVQLEAVGSQLAREYWEDNRRDILGILEDSFLEEYDEFNVGVAFRNAAEVSISYSLMLRCGLEPENYFEHEDFMGVFDFNTPETAGALGTVVSGINQQVLREIGATIRNYERELIAERSITDELRMQALPIESFITVSAEEALPNALGLLLRLAVADGRLTDEELLSIQPVLDGRAWRPDLAVQVGDVFSFNASLWRCLQAHTTQSDWLPDCTPALWRKVEVIHEDEVRVWQTGVDYIVGDEVAYPDATGDVYVCQQAHTSLSGWEPPAVPALWTQKEQ